MAHNDDLHANPHRTASARAATLKTAVMGTSGRLNFAAQRQAEALSALGAPP